jgi:hypothetical protein
VAHSDNLTLNRYASLHPLGDDTVLFLEHSGQTHLLSPMAALICRGLGAGMSVSEITESLPPPASGCSEAITSDVQRFVDELRAVGAIGAGVAVSSNASGPRVTGVRRTIDVSTVAPSASTRSYQLLDFRFTLRTSDADIAVLSDQLLGHLECGKASSAGPVLDIVHEDGMWLLARDGAVVDACRETTGIVPMVHANTAMMSYEETECVAAVHAAAVTRGDECILMPALSGSGKTTLTAALLAAGLGYCTDDLALLVGDPLRVRGVGTCLGLKTGSWDLLTARYPEVTRLPTHVRADEVDVRYLPPPRNALSQQSATRQVRAIIFPSFRSGDPVRSRPLTPGEGLTRLTEAGYDLPQLNRNSLVTLIDWISGVPCLELGYGNLDDAVSMVSRELE